MLIIAHVVLALSALGVSTAGFFKPSPNRLRISYGLAAGTLGTGVLLIVIAQAGILRTCLSGIMFFGIVSLLNELARRKFALQNRQN